MSYSTSFFCVWTDASADWTDGADGPERTGQCPDVWQCKHWPNRSIAFTNVFLKCFKTHCMTVWIINSTSLLCSNIVNKFAVLWWPKSAEITNKQVG